MAEVVEMQRPGKSKRAGSKPGSAGTPENSGITNTIACCFIFSRMRGPEGSRGMWESYFLLYLANGTSSSFYARFIFL